MAAAATSRASGRYRQNAQYRAARRPDNLWARAVRAICPRYRRRSVVPRRCDITSLIPTGDIRTSRAPMDGYNMISRSSKSSQKSGNIESLEHRLRPFSRSKAVQPVNVLLILYPSCCDIVRCIYDLYADYLHHLSTPGTVKHFNLFRTFPRSVPRVRSQDPD